MPLIALEEHKVSNIFYFECRGKRTQGSGTATGFPMNHPVHVQYKLDLGASTLTEVDIDTDKLSAGKEPIDIKIYGKTLTTKFHNKKIKKDYEIQIRGDDRLFSITIFPSSGFNPDAWYGRCTNS
ncbi:hypothetical protein [Synechococcus sp. UW179A]|uniref:hypothetical protein n=1 Tax=Synechococcus sp. UW179A TaxID=2575510 RepID=UPI001A7E12CD|nr:hypothetical protein [Synechococcus sp. UW179A]